MAPSLLLAVTLAVGAPTDDAKGASALVGTWVEEKAVVEGKEKSADKLGMTFTFGADGQFVVKQPMRLRAEEGTYKADPTKDPAEIDFMPSDDKVVGRGIHKIDGDTLTLCFGRGKDSQR